MLLIAEVRKARSRQTAGKRREIRGNTHRIDADVQNNFPAFIV